jgi:hypothetical protein
VRVTHKAARKFCQSSRRWGTFILCKACTSGAGISARMSAGNLNEPKVTYE